LSFNIIDLALLIAASQGFLLTTLIFHRHGRLFANRFLGMVIFLYSFILLDMFLWDIGFYIARPHLRLITIGLPLTIAPMHYLYARYLTRSLSHLKKSDVLHFFPALAVSLYLWPFRSISAFACFSLLIFSPCLSNSIKGRRPSTLHSTIG